jgi:hypothetical protein
MPKKAAFIHKSHDSHEEMMMMRPHIVVTALEKEYQADDTRDPYLLHVRTGLAVGTFP